MLSRMILEIETYVTSPMKNPEDNWELQERIFLGHILADLLLQREAMGVARYSVGGKQSFPPTSLPRMTAATRTSDGQPLALEYKK